MRFWTTYGILRSAFVSLSMRALVQDLRAFGQSAGLRLLDRGLLVEQPELQQRGLADERLGALGILHARQLDQDAIGALTGDGGLGHAELVHAVADGLHALADRVVAQLASPPARAWPGVNRPAFSSRSRTSKLLNSAATVRASFQFDGLASSTTIDE